MGKPWDDLLFSKPPAPPEVFLFVHVLGCANQKIRMKGGDRVDADGIPLYTIMHHQKAQFLELVCGLRPRFTSPWICRMLSQGNPGPLGAWVPLL